MKAIMFFLFLLPLFLSGQEFHYTHSIHYSFIENKGQWKNNVLFKKKIRGGNLWVEQGKFLYQFQDFSNLEKAHFSSKKGSEKLPQQLVHVNFNGANHVYSIEKSFPTPNYFNYFIGNNPHKWARNVHGFGEVILRDLYDGIDLKIMEQEEDMKYEFIVSPHTDPSVIQFEYVGQKNIRINKKGELIIETDLGKIIEKQPYVYQIINGKIISIPATFSLNDNTVSFDIGEYKKEYTLIIDPVLIFATYSGSVTDNFGMTATYGYDGTAYSGGMVYGNAYPTPANAYDTSSNFTGASSASYGITDVFISKYSPDGSTMLWTTFIGGGDDTQGTETAQSLICDKNNNIYVYGSTSSTDFPIVNGFQSSHAGGVPNTNFYFNGVYFSATGSDIFVAKISADGLNLMGSTYIGGSGNDGVNYSPSNLPYNSVTHYDSLTKNYGDQFRGEIMLDSLGNCIIASTTLSSDFPTQNAFQPNNAGGQDGVLFKLSSDLSSLLWSSYFGGSGNDACYSVKIDSNYRIVFAGGTTSNDLPATSNVWQNTYNGGEADGFVAKLDESNYSLIKTSYIGTSNYDQTFFVEIDRASNVYLVGQSNGGNFPVVNTNFVNPGSSQFIMKLDSTLQTVIHSTVFGSGNPVFDISPSAFLVDICGNIYVSGWGATLLGNTPMGGMPVTSNAYQTTAPNGFDFYLIVIERDFQGLLYGTYMGGATAREHVDGGTSRFDKNGVVYQSVCGGCGGHSDFPTTPNAWSSQNLSTNCNNLIFKFDFELIPKAEFTIDNNIGCRPFTVTFTNNSSASDSYLWDFGNGDTTSIIFEPVVTYDTVGVFDIYLYVTDSICLITDTAKITITVYDSLELSTSPNISICTPTPQNLIVYTNGTASEFIWSSNINFTDTLNNDITDSVFTVTPPGNITYYIQVGNGGCYKIDSISVEVVSSSLILQANDSICSGESTIITATSSNPAITFNNFTWSPDSIITSQNNLNNVQVTPSETQYVYVTATSNTGCNATDSILIYVGNIPDSLIEASAESYNVPEGASVQLYGEPNGYFYSWTPEHLLNDETLQNPIATVNNPTLFTLFISDGICTKSDTVFIKTFGYVCDESYIYIPNAFSPNGDGENDILYVRGPMVESMVFRVFDRWGEMVFESFERPYGWDGTYKGKPLDPDVYDYYLKAICIDGSETIIKGNVTLIR